MKIKLFIILPFLALISSCISEQYTITNEYIKCNKKSFGNFQISKLSVDSLNKEGLPEIFQIEFKISASLDYEEKFRKIEFDENDNRINWTFNDTVAYNEIPIKFEHECWYLISNLPYNNHTCFLFVYVDKNGNMLATEVKRRWSAFYQ